jgi:uncharacterized membrane protein YkgB
MPGVDQMADRVPARDSRVVSAVPKRSSGTGRAAERLEVLGGQLLRYGLVGILVYLGAFKFTAVEAHAIEPLVGNSPLTAWLYSLLSVRGVSNLIGTTELLMASLIALRAVVPAVSAWGSLGAVGMFLTTLSFLVTTPGVWERVPGFPLPVPTAGGGFLLKDMFLLGAAAWSAGEARRAARERP